MNIPTEISLGIFSFLSTTDIKAVRLVCHELASLGSNFLCPNPYISPYQEDTEVFVAISSHSEIRRSIRNIIYNSASFYDIILDTYLQELHQQITQLLIPVADDTVPNLEHLLARRLYPLTWVGSGNPSAGRVFP